MNMQQAISRAATKLAPRTPGLTPKQDELLRYLMARERSGEGTPSYEEMAKALGVASKSNVHRLIEGLEERGYVHRIPNRARQLTVTKPWAGQSLKLVPTADLARELRNRGWSVAQ